MFGAGNLALIPLLVVCLNEVLGLPAFMQVLVTTALPVLVVPIAIQPWARYLDRHRVLAFRAVHGKVNVRPSCCWWRPCCCTCRRCSAGCIADGREHGGGQPRVDARPQ